jgi:hypothetical protein
MELNLREIAPSTPVLNAGISVDNMSWWFWIKAGMGLMFGAWLVSMIGAMLFWSFWIGVFGAYARHGMR